MKRKWNQFLVLSMFRPFFFSFFFLVKVGGQAHVGFLINVLLLGKIIFKIS